MKIYIGADHQGFQLKQALLTQLASHYDVIDLTDGEANPEDDYPMIAAKVVRKLLADKSDDARAVLICGSGQGVAIAANRFKGIRAALCWNDSEARSSRNDDDSNVLCLASRNTDTKLALSITETWLKTPFSRAGRYIRRIEELDRLP